MEFDDGCAAQTASLALSHCTDSRISKYGSSNHRPPRISCLAGEGSSRRFGRRSIQG
ncbi:unnamed protein product [Mycena citricolor]|uniref:Uncharacterized protein n=1 Tax=Mycena citricolor TaxID=2018698 RepID=A0AAD2H7Y0_9AGAR|nr:unnamed protein product [Mycena citricolor]